MAKSEYSEEKGLALAEYINNIREHRGLGHNQLALLAGLDSLALHKILHGIVKKANPFHLQSIAKVLKIDYKILYRIVGYLEPLDTESISNESIEYNIPVYSKIYNDEDMLVKFGETLEYVNMSSLNTNNNLFGIQTTDDSMIYSIPQHSIVLVEQTTKIQNNDIGLFILNGLTYVRRYVKTENCQLLIAGNKNYSSYEIKKTDDFIIVGKIIKAIIQI